MFEEKYRVPNNAPVDSNHSDIASNLFLSSNEENKKVERNQLSEENCTQDRILSVDGETTEEGMEILYTPSFHLSSSSSLLERNKLFAVSESVLSARCSGPDNFLETLQTKYVNIRI